MRVRAVDGSNDWLFGKGKNSYVRDSQAIGQNIKTRLMSFLGDCFFAQTEGIDWFNLLGGKELLEIELAMGATILNTEGVLGILQLDLRVDEKRRLYIEYAVQTVFSPVYGSFDFEPLSEVQNG